MRTGAIPPGREKAFRAALGKRWRAVLDVGLVTGWRISDILALRPEDITGRTVEMTARKTGKTAKAVLPASLSRRLRASAGQFWLFPSPADPTFPVTRQAALKAFNRACSASGLSRVSPHSMRRSFARSLYRAGHTVFEVQKALQHDKLETTLLYLMDIQISPEGRVQSLMSGKGT
jgi:integrase